MIFEINNFKKDINLIYKFKYIFVNKIEKRGSIF